jgi:hypothetical protein
MRITRAATESKIAVYTLVNSLGAPVSEALVPAARKRRDPGVIRCHGNRLNGCGIPLLPQIRFLGSLLL